MKFAIVAVLALALAMGVESSVIPWGAEIAGNGLSYTAVSRPAVLGGPWGPWGAWGPWGHGPAVVLANPPAAVTVAQSPSHVLGPILTQVGPVVSHAPAVVVAPSVEGSYVAKTRGAIHSAPLAGHAQSVASINVQPAPGTV
jgi:hypothetical protein